MLSEPIIEAESDHAAPIASSIASTSGSGSNVRGVDYNPEPFESERLPVSLASEIQRFLRVANSIEREEPRIACLCKLFGLTITMRNSCLVQKVIFWKCWKFVFCIRTLENIPHLFVSQFVFPSRYSKFLLGFFVAKDSE